MGQHWRKRKPQTLVHLTIRNATNAIYDFTGTLRDLRTKYYIHCIVHYCKTQSIGCHIYGSEKAHYSYVIFQGRHICDSEKSHNTYFMVQG